MECQPYVGIRYELILNVAHVCQTNYGPDLFWWKRWIFCPEHSCRILCKDEFGEEFERLLDIAVNVTGLVVLFEDDDATDPLRCAQAAKLNGT